ncbi:hypothetical protein [Candidatus Atelocyanobacterium thalassae]|nr:hypothetical protein [Candidatus Atelocyanobacterium thalassa]
MFTTLETIAKTSSETEITGLLAHELANFALSHEFQ